MNIKNPEYRIFEVDQYGNRWFVTSVQGSRENAEMKIRNLPKLSDGTYDIEVA